MRRPIFKQKSQLTSRSFLNDAESSESSENEAPQTRRGRAGNGQARDRVAEKEKARMKLREDIAKAAGGPLTGVD